LPECVCSASDGGRIRIAGNRDWQGYARGLGYQPEKLPGEDFTFTGSTRDGNGVEGSAYCEALKVHWNTARGKYIWYELLFAADGQLARGSYSATDTGTPNTPSPRGLGISLDSSAEDNVMRMDLVLACSGAPYVDSGTDGWTYREAGNFDGYVQYVRRFDDWADLPVQGEIYQVDVDCTGSLTWRMKWARIALVQELVPIKPPERGRPKLLYALVVAKFTSFDDSDTKGEIVAPDSTIWWPE
jgi:hypothetical protein